MAVRFSAMRCMVRARAVGGRNCAVCAVELDFSALPDQSELGLPPSLRLGGDDAVRSGIAWRKAFASKSGHSIHSACPTDGIQNRGRLTDELRQVGLLRRWHQKILAPRNHGASLCSIWRAAGTKAMRKLSRQIVR